MLNLRNHSWVEFLPLTILLLGFLLRVLFIFFFNTVYVYDEVVVTEISKQPIDILLKTIKAEPHPPGFYLFLKLFSERPDKLVKIIIATTSFVLSLAAVVYVQKTKLLNRYKLSLGLSFLFGSFTFMSVSTTIKQDAISVPLFLFFLATALYLLSKRTKKNMRHLVLANILLFTLLSVGYVLYLQALVIIAAVTFSLKKNKISVLLLAIQFSILALFLKFWWLEQISTNQSRFTWFSENYNSFVQSFGAHLIGFKPVIFFADIIIITAIGLVLFFSYKTLRALPKIDLRFTVLCLIVLLIIISYTTESFVRTRYTFTLFALISFGVGWALEELTVRKKVFLVILVPFLLFGLSGFYIAQIQSSKEIDRRIEIYKELSEKGAYGAIDTNGGLFSQVAKIKYLVGENIVPINIYYPKLYSNKQGIDYEMLAKEGHRPLELHGDIVKTLLSENRLENFIYVVDKKDKRAYVDGDLIILNTLQKNCVPGEVYNTAASTIFTYENCIF
jgi:hypothetical protein